jgi:NAD(P)-dependent dehydrogenase (short-subunit alcohol dehydrogenase family)
MAARTALITGASRGIGAAIKERLGRDGITLLTPDRAELDLLSNASLDVYLASLNSPVDILVNNAGINHLAALEEISPEKLEAMLQINLTAPILLTRAVAAGMKANRYGRIVNISSIFGIVSRERRLMYTATKSGLIGITKALALELGSYNILVNAVAPGYVMTELTRQNNTDKELEAITKTIPMRRLAEPEEIAEVVAFLCSDKNTYITGQTIVCDGGFTCA